MASILINKNHTLFEAGQPVSQLYLILKGSISITYPGGTYQLGKGDVCGILEINQEIYNTTCIAMEDSTLLPCSVSDIETLATLFKASPDYIMIFLKSAFHQINIILQQLDMTQLGCNDLFSFCSQEYAFYQACCKRHKLKARVLNEMENLTTDTEDCSLAGWLSSYYDGFQQLLSDNSLSALSKESSVPTGLIAGICSDAHKIFSYLKTLHTFEKQLFQILINENLEDLFDILSSLYYNLGPDSSDSPGLLHKLKHIMELISNSGIDPQMYAERFDDFQDSICALSSSGSKKQDETNTKQSALLLLRGSMDTILSFSQAEEDFCSDFRKLITKYSSLSDKNATDDAARALRLQITKHFYKLYRLVFIRSIDEYSLPIPVRMFLYFGYVDEKLAGEDNAIYLYHIAEHVFNDSPAHIYTMYDWLLAIYRGEKEPSRNEFEVDYTDHIHTLKISGKITAEEEAKYAKDMLKKVDYELENMFPVVNKITYGRVTSHCPVFSAHNVLKQLDLALVSADVLKEALQNVIDLDYSVFYREYVYSNTSVGIQKEFLHMEVIPDILLTPCVGTRGVMWQEIEGKKRTTSARMMLPVFYLEDLPTAIARLAGEYRWEMCKRIQGARWNDVSDRSLTSEYFDYIQFYKKNHELSPEAKEKIKSSLQKAHNSFKEMFVRDYITYLLYEGMGSPRLMKPARAILFNYCPFSEKARKPLLSNPIYKEMIDYYLLKKNQQLHRLDLLTKRIENSGSPIPSELSNERAFLER